MRGGGVGRGGQAFHCWKTAGDPGGWLLATVLKGIIPSAARVAVIDEQNSAYDKPRV